VTDYAEIAERGREGANELLAQGWELISTHVIEYDQRMSHTDYARQSHVVYVMGRRRPIPNTGPR
jgi:hypothetical protein